MGTLVSASRARASAADALAIFEPVAAGVASAHRHGVVHGRIRPENVLFDGEGNAFVADLGVDEICTGILTFATHAYDAPERLGGALATPARTSTPSASWCTTCSAARRPHSTGRCRRRRSSRRASSPGRPTPTRAAATVGRRVGRRAARSTRRPSRPTTVFVPTRNPYRGLAAFEQADAEDFHGREHAVAQMVEVLERERLLVVVGPSGIGKSSVVKAGLVPALAEGASTAPRRGWSPRWCPGGHLRSARHRAGARRHRRPSRRRRTSWRLDPVARRHRPRPPAADTELVVVIDQFEELFTHTVDDGERRAFLQMLVDAAGRPDAVVRLVATLRADYFDRPLGYAGFADAIKGRTVALGAMTAAELAEAIRRPAAGVGVESSRRSSTGSPPRPSCSPAPSRSSSTRWPSCSPGATANTITLAAYEESGGLAGAIGRRAEAIYAGLDDAPAAAARRCSFASST